MYVVTVEFEIKAERIFLYEVYADRVAFDLHLAAKVVRTYDRLDPR